MLIFLYIYSDKYIPLKVSIPIGLLLLIVIFVWKFCVEYNKIGGFGYKRKEVVYGEAIILLNDSYAQFNTLKKSNFGDEEFVATAKHMCDDLKELFDSKTRAKCSVSIKVCQSGRVKADDAVENLCRDTSHSSRDTEKYKETKHTILGNSGYTHIIDSVQKRDEKNIYYINDNIPSTPGYKNTSKHLYENGILPYKSELIHPILPIGRNRKNEEDFDVWGFICIDCENALGFDDKYDKAIIEGVADGVHGILMARNSFKNQ